MNKKDKPKRLCGMRAAMAVYTGFHGHNTVAALLSQIPEELLTRLTGYEMGLVMNAVNDAFYNGRVSNKRIDIVDDCVWLPFGGDILDDGKEQGRLIPIDALKSVNITVNKRSRRYTLDYSELF
jgi:hypothetical protein